MDTLIHYEYVLRSMMDKQYITVTYFLIFTIHITVYYIVMSFKIMSQTFICCGAVNRHNSGCVYPLISIALVDRIRELKDEWTNRDSDDMSSVGEQYKRTLNCSNYYFVN